MRSSPDPVILPRSQHSVSRTRIDPDALKVLYRLHHCGYKAYLVGGSVRDLLLGKTPRDFDIGTDAHPNQVRRLFRNCRIIGRRFRLAHILFHDGKVVEVATFRRHAEVTQEEGGVARVNFNTFGSPEEDARRRDITINGLFYDIATYSVIDYIGGLQDLRRRIIRTIKDPAESFEEDPVRIVRVMRHAARNGFAVDPSTWREVMLRQKTVMQCSMDRVREEFYKDLTSGCFASVLELFHASGFLYSLFPEFELPGTGRLRARIDFLHALMEAAAVIDRRIASSQAAGHPAAPLALLLMPYFSLNAWMAEPEPGENLTEYLEKRLDEILEPLFLRIRISVETRKEIRHRILMCERIRQAVHRFGTVPAALRQKRSFEEGLALYEADLERRGETPPAPGIAGGEPIERQPDAQKSHRRRRRRRRPRPAPLTSPQRVGGV